MGKTIEINVCLQNLGKYNEGELVFEWLSLPATNEEIQDTFEAIGINEEYEEYMIADYEAPFNINEFSNVYTINEIAGKLSDIELVDFGNSYSYNYVDDLNIIKNLAYELDVEVITEDYYTLEEVNELELYPLNDAGKVDLTRMYFFLGDITGNTEVVRINGYGNLEEVTKNDLEDLQEEVLNNFLGNL